MQTRNETADSFSHAREIFIRHQARYEVSQYFVVLDDRTFGKPPSRRRIPAGFDLDLYAVSSNGSALSFRNGGVREVVAEMATACSEAIAGDATLFAREDYVEEAWRIVDPVLRADTPVHAYEPGMWGPPDETIVPPGGWHTPMERPPAPLREAVLAA